MAGACLVCGEDLEYLDNEIEMECSYCKQKFMSNARCKSEHYICDECHSKEGIRVVRKMCLETETKNPIELIQQMMQNPFIYMHGPEHHIMVGSALLAAYRNSGGDIDLEVMLNKMEERGKKVPGGVCGFWGCCGAAVSSGIFVSLITGSTPLGKEEWGVSNLMTSQSLGAIGKIGGPRCCKRNSFTAILQAVDYVKEIKGINMEKTEKIVCEYSSQNKQCIGQRCPYCKHNM